MLGTDREGDRLSCPRHREADIAGEHAMDLRQGRLVDDRAGNAADEPSHCWCDAARLTEQVERDAAAGGIGASANRAGVERLLQA